MIIAGDSRKPRSLLAPDYNNWAPRIGLAWHVPHVKGLVIRSSYGIFYAQDTGLGVIARLTGNPPFYGYGGLSIISDQLNPATGFVVVREQPSPVPPRSIPKTSF